MRGSTLKAPQKHAGQKVCNKDKRFVWELYDTMKKYGPKVTGKTALIRTVCCAKHARN